MGNHFLINFHMTGKVSFQYMLLVLFLLGGSYASWLCISFFPMSVLPKLPRDEEEQVPKHYYERKINKYHNITSRGEQTNTITLLRKGD